MTPIIKLAISEDDINKCKEAILFLRPHLLADQLYNVLREMFSEGYKLAFIEENGKAVSIVGYRYQQFLYNGKQLYIDDLCTLPGSKGKGYGLSLLNYVEQEGRSKGYNVITLDSGFQRKDAHRLYLNFKFVIDSFHFSKKI